MTRLLFSRPARPLRHPNRLRERDGTIIALRSTCARAAARRLGSTFTNLTRDVYDYKTIASPRLILIVLCFIPCYLSYFYHSFFSVELLCVWNCNLCLCNKLSFFFLCTSDFSSSLHISSHIHHHTRHPHLHW